MKEGDRDASLSSGKKKGAPAENRNAKNDLETTQKQPKNNPSIQPRNDLNIDIEKDIAIDIDTAPNERGRKRTCFLLVYKTGDALRGSMCVHPGAS